MDKANAKYIVSTILTNALSLHNTERFMKESEYPKLAEFYKLFMDGKMDADKFHENAVNYVLACNSKLGKSLL